MRVRILRNCKCKRVNPIASKLQDRMIQVVAGIWVEMVSIAAEDLVTRSHHLKILLWSVGSLTCKRLWKAHFHFCLGESPVSPNYRSFLSILPWPRTGFKEVQRFWLVKPPRSIDVYQPVGFVPCKKYSHDLGRITFASDSFCVYSPEPLFRAQVPAFLKLRSLGNAVMYRALSEFYDN